MDARIDADNFNSRNLFSPMECHGMVNKIFVKDFLKLIKKTKILKKRYSI